MKRKDIVTIVFIIGLSMIAAIVVSKLLVSTPKNRQQKVEVTSVVNAEFTGPDDKIFNKDAINPTQNIQIGADHNDTPLNSVTR